MGHYDDCRAAHYAAEHEKDITFEDIAALEARVAKEGVINGYTEDTGNVMLAAIANKSTKLEVIGTGYKMFKIVVKQTEKPKLQFTSSMKNAGEVVDYYKSKPSYEFKVKELTELQRKHMAWRLDNRTASGLFTANSISRMENGWGEKTLLEVFSVFCTGDNKKQIEEKAKRQSHKVLKFDNFGTLIERH